MFSSMESEFVFDHVHLSCEDLPLNDVLNYHPSSLEITRLRLWLTNPITQFIVGYIMTSWTEAKAEVEDELHGADTEMTPDASFIRSLRTPVELKPFAELQQLKQLDIFIPQDPSNPSRFIRLGWGSPDCPIDTAAVEMIKTYLKSVFAHIDNVRIWRAHSENITSGKYVAF